MAKVTQQNVQNTAGISEKVTPAYPGDPKFSVFGGSAVAGKTKGVQYTYSTTAGIMQSNNVPAKYDPKFSNL